ncbi:hypothetical protein M9Y10_033653 [Tritrichomonas musculus]|uniref:CWH43-like N-terminal domain-containing protein n=1 Tax=Tritrichomonas musculus TaxID=1915356 RepID=A0ABR2KDE9_9EUKA
MNSFQPILYNPFVLGCIVSIMPIFVTVTAFLFSIYNGHFSLHFNSLPKINQVMVQLPEKRVYSVGMNLTAWLALPVFLLIDRIIKLKCKIEKCHKEPLTYCLRWLMNVCAGFAFFGMLGMASVTVHEMPYFRQTCYRVMIIFLTIYYLIVDFEMTKAKLNVTLLNRIWSFGGIFFITLSYLFSKYAIILSNTFPNINFLSISAICQYIHVPLMSLKFLLIWKTLPSCGVLVSKKNE